MSLKQIFDIKQSLAITQDIQESLKILQLSNVELISYIHQKLEDNPFLTLDTYENHESSSELNDEKVGIFDDEFYAKISENCGYNFSSTTSHFEQYFAEEKDLRSFILEQIQFLFHTEREKMIAVSLTDLLDDKGYLTNDYYIALKEQKFNKLEIERVIKLMQTIEPTGIFARSLQECLKIQLIDLGIYDTKFEAIVQNLEYLVKYGQIALSKKLNINNDELQNYLEKIQSLNPKPVNSFKKGNAIQIIPDIVVKIEGENIFVDLNFDLLPKISVNKEFYFHTKNNVKHQYDKNYLSNHYNHANTLINSIKHRSSSLLKIAKIIVKKQNNFFFKGMEFLTSLSMQDIADELNLSISSISRIMANKYLASPHGVFELKYFLSGGYANQFNEGEDYSSKSIMNMISKIIENETENIFSDNEIAEILQNNGINIARRTVTKYREQIGIDSSAIRKRKKRIKII